VAVDPARRRRALLLGSVLLLGLVLRLPTFARLLISDDEAIYATTADAMRRGAVLYRDAVDHKPPAIYDVYLASFKVMGPYNTQGAHALAVGASLLCAIALWRAAERMAWNVETRAAAALLWVVFSTTMLDYDSLAANCELFVVCLQAMAFAWLVTDRNDRPIGLPAWLGIGVLTGASAMFKYQGATFILVIAVAALLGWRTRRRSAARTVASLSAAAAGCLVVPSFYAWHLWHQGGLDAAIWWFQFNFAYVREGPSGFEAVGRGLVRVALVGGAGATVVYALGLPAAWRTVTDWWRARSRRGLLGLDPDLERRTLAVAWLAAGAVALAVGARFFGHYFHLVTPALSLLAAGPLVRAWEIRRGWRPVLAALVLIPAAAGLACATVLRAEAIALTDPEPDYRPVAAALDRLAAPNEAVFVWGNSPQLYVFAQRPMGARFSFCNYMTGISPGTRTETGEANADTDQLPEAWQMLFADLDSRRPRWFVDAAAAGWDGYASFPLPRFPRLDVYVQAHYTLRERVDGVVIYERGDR
jgi:hypothetical protein